VAQWTVTIGLSELASAFQVVEYPFAMIRAHANDIKVQRWAVPFLLCHDGRQKERLCRLYGRLDLCNSLVDCDVGVVSLLFFVITDVDFVVVQDCLSAPYHSQV